MHTKGQAIDFIEKCFGSSTPSNGGLNVSVVCPKCAEKTDNLQKRKLVIRTTDFLTHCWVCGYRAPNLNNLLSEYHPFFTKEYRENFTFKQEFERCELNDVLNLFGHSQSKSPTKQVQLPTGFYLLANNIGKGIRSADLAWDYLRKKRGLTTSDLWYWKFGITEFMPPKGETNYRFRIITPSFNQDGELNFFSARSYWDKLPGPKYRNPDAPRESIVFNELNIDWTQELTITEGVFDLVKCNTNATCLLGSTLDSSYLLFQKIVENNTPVLLALDNDAKSKTYELAKLFLEYGISVRLFEVPKQFNDVGEMTKVSFQEEAKRSRLFTNADYFRWKINKT